MGRRDKRYSKSLHQQAYEKLTGMQAFGESKKAAMKTGTADDKIFSFSTYKTYWKHVKYFLQWIQQEHPDVTRLKAARRYVNDWLQSRVDQVDKRGQHLSAWTIQTEAAAVNKLYGITADDPGRFQPPKRNRGDIKRSRGEAARDRHFSVTNNDFLIRFCRGTGLRRAGVESVKGRDLLAKEDLVREIEELEQIPEALRSPQQKTKLSICHDASLFFDKCDFFVHTKEKGGRERISPIVGPDIEKIVARFKETDPDKKIWQHVNRNADIHSYRGDYASRIYGMYARDLDEIPYDRTNQGTGKRFKSEMYVCRKDEKGKKLDKRAMLLCSKALGHNRLEVVANNYLRNL